MLVLSRQRDETIMIGDDIELTVVDIRGDKVRLGIKAPEPDGQEIRHPLPPGSPSLPLATSQKFFCLTGRIRHNQAFLMQHSQKRLDLPDA